MEATSPRWEPLLALLTTWGRPLTPEDGCIVADIEATERRLGRDLPAAVHEWYALIGRCQELTNRESHLTPLKALEIVSMSELLAPTSEEEAGFPVRLELYSENQNLYGWVLLESDLEMPDPPVYLEDADGLFSEELVTLANTRFSIFASLMVAWELYGSATWTASVHTPEQEAEVLAQSLFHPLAEEALGFPIPLRFWTYQEALIVTMGTEWFGIASHSQALLETLRELLAQHTVVERFLTG